MKFTKIKRWASVLLTAAMILSAFAGCSDNNGGGSSSKAESVAESNLESSGGDTAVSDTETDTDGKPDTWIADRTVVIQAYVDDIGYSLPKDLENTPVFKELTERTGIKLEVKYTPGDDDASVMSSQLAAGNIPDVIISYLNDSTRPEFPVLLKAAKEEMFADVSEMMKDSEVYSKYYEEDYLPGDSYKNIVFREDFNGSVYLLPLQIEEIDRTAEYLPESELRGGMYIQSKIADELGVDPRDIKTQDVFYDLLVKIKDGGFEDDNGNPVYPLGPKYWGGSVDSMQHIMRGFNWGVANTDDDYNIDENGNIIHEAETDYVYEKVAYARKLLDEGLMNPEFFTMDATRAEEASKSKNSAIIGDVHNYMDVIYTNDDWVPLGPLNDRTGSNVQTAMGKGANGVWAISSEAENPEEIFAFFDYLSTKEGQLLGQYGIEGVSYEMQDGNPRVIGETLEKLEKGDEADKDWLIQNVGASFGGNACYLFEMIETNRNNIDNFGEARPGSSVASSYQRSIEIAEEYPIEKKLIEGLNPSAFLSTEGLEDVKEQMDLMDYKETLVQAFFAESDEEAEKIIESFKAQLKSAGVEKFETKLKEIYDEDPTAIRLTQP